MLVVSGLKLGKEPIKKNLVTVVMIYDDDNKVSVQIDVVQEYSELSYINK